MGLKFYRYFSSMFFLNSTNFSNSFLIIFFLNSSSAIFLLFNFRLVHNLFSNLLKITETLFVLCRQRILHQILYYSLWLTHQHYNKKLIRGVYPLDLATLHWRECLNFYFILYKFLMKDIHLHLILLIFLLFKILIHDS